MRNKIARQYLHCVSRGMPIHGKQKRQFLAALEEDVIRYTEENPDASASQIQEQFGSPDDIAADFIDQMPHGQIRKKFRVRNRIVAVAAIGALLIVAIWLSTALVAMHDALDNDPGYIVDNLIVEETERKTK